ncbi:MAG: ABC transporter ATP-binding protein [Planctomycetes bacterium]|nr:ABC transporter ATP-binding protein [Planctomycetota bacterium]MCB9890398.1 ABC transporter ATP-binding protein [Planctomycetota bacterium]MCB9917639.1 ABC transporter ATP-binding protein [Planctomycetota bacterium]
MIEIKNLEKTYMRAGERVVACRVDALEVAAGEQIAIVGPSGCGKTTLLHIVSGLLIPDHGSVRVDGQDLFALSERARDRFRAARFGYVHQTFDLLSGFTALENVELAQYFAAGKTDRARAREFLAHVGLEERMHHRPRELSIGQQQRVAIARALINSPRLLLADEPTGSQDPDSAKRSLALLRDLATEVGATMLLVTHDPASADAMERKVDLRALSGAAR